MISSVYPVPENAERIEILEAFSDLLDVRRAAGKRHPMALCLALFTLAVTAGNRGFLAIGDWLACYRCDLIALFNPPKSRLPSYSTIRPVLLELDYVQYSASLARFFGIEPLKQDVSCWWQGLTGVVSTRDRQC